VGGDQRGAATARYAECQVPMGGEQSDEAAPPLVASIIEEDTMTVTQLRPTTLPTTARGPARLRRGSHHE